MNKKAIVSFAAFLAMLCALTACGKKNTSPYGKLIVDSKGMEHVIATDASGVTVVDAAGNLVEVVTNSDDKKPIEAPTENGTYADGEYQTNSVTFPKIMEDGTRVENQYCSVNLPEGWKQTGALQIIIEKEGTDAQINIDSSIDKSFDAALERLDSDRAKLENAEYKYDQTETTIGGRNAVCEKYTFSNVIRAVYIVETESGSVLQIACTASADQFNATDFDAVLQNIQFK